MARASPTLWSSAPTSQRWVQLLPLLGGRWGPLLLVVPLPGILSLVVTRRASASAVRLLQAGLANVASTVFNLMGYEAPSHMESSLIAA